MVEWSKTSRRCGSRSPTRQIGRNLLTLAGGSCQNISRAVGNKRGKKSVVTKVGEKSWRDRRLSACFLAKLTIVHVGHLESAGLREQQWWNS